MRQFLWKKRVDLLRSKISLVKDFPVFLNGQVLSEANYFLTKVQCWATEEDTSSDSMFTIALSFLQVLRLQNI